MIRWTLWLIFITAWTIALETPVPNPEDLPGGQVIATNRYLIAKSLHVAVYAVFAFSAGLLRIPARYRWLMMLFLMGHAVATELLQSALQTWCNRTGSIYDAGFDQIGIMIGAALGWKWWTAESGERGASAP